MALDFFGFKIVRTEKEIKAEERKSINSIVPPLDTEGSVVSSGGYFGTSYSLEFSTTNENLLINKYREIGLQAEVESAIDEIVNEAISTDGQEAPVSLDLQKVKYSDDIKDSIRDEFTTILSLLNFDKNSYEIFRRWYVDGRIYYYIAIDTNSPKDGIQQLSYMDPRRVKRIKEVNREKNPRGVEVISDITEFYVYNEHQNLKLPVDSVASVTSGLVDDKNNIVVLSYLHKAIKPLNQLRMLEDATVIYRLSRAPERRIFYIDVGNLPKVKAEQYVNDIMNKYRNKIVYDSETGEVRDDKKTQTMTEDFWLPRREGGRGTEIGTLPGGMNLGELTDVQYFQRKLYRSLHVPVARLDDAATFNTGRSTEINREEIKFFKFVQRLRTRFSALFSDLLRKQLILKEIITPDEWETELKHLIFYDFRGESHFMEFNESEIISRRMEVAKQAIDMGEGYYSQKYIRQNFLKQTDQDMEQIDIDNGMVNPEKDRETETGIEGGGIPPEEETPVETPEPETPEAEQ